MDQRYFAFVEELFAGVGPVHIKRMFGGAGVYADGKMFALLADEVVYLKTDGALQQDLAAAGSQPFIWSPQNGPRKGERVEMGYWRLPDAALDDPETACAWAKRAIQVASVKAAASAKKSAKTGARNPKD